jgi:lauroyl/myristoyl acyltransferase
MDSSPATDQLRTSDCRLPTASRRPPAAANLSPPAPQPGMLKRVAYPLGGLVARRLSWPAARWLVRRIAGLNFAVDSRARRAAAANMRVVLGGRPEVEVRRAARRLFDNFAMTVAELLGAAPGAFERLCAGVEISGEDAVRERLGRGRGAVVVGAHLGNWELAGACLGRLGAPHGCLALSYEHPAIARRFLSCRRALGMNPVDVRLDLRAALDILRRGGAVGVVGDRLYGGSAVEARFFGRSVRFPAGPARLAIHSGADLIPLFVVRRPEGGYRIRWHPPISLPKEGGEDERIRAATQEFGRALEQEVRMSPEQWVCFFPFFQQQAADPQ